MLDALSSAAEIAAARPSLAVLPIGSIEQHSRHLPLGTDWIAATALAHRVGAELGALVLPTLPVSMGRCHKPMAGTVWLRPMTLADAVTDVIRSLAASGIRHVLIVNGHGGNFTLEVAVRELNVGSPELTVLLPPMSLRSKGPQIFETAGLEVHAGESETSVMLAIDASLVGDDRVDYIPPVGREYLDYALVGDISPEGVWGKPSLATREKGQRALEGRVRGLCDYARDTFERVARLKGQTPPLLAPSSGTGRWMEWGPWAIGPGLSARSTTVEVGRARPATAILPVATVEPHGPHLPAGTDLLIVEAVARRAARALGDAYLLPTIPFGTSAHVRGLAGTADLTPDVLRRVVQDVAVGLHETGIHRVAIIAGPGLVSGNTVVPFGNFILKAAVRQLNHEYPEMDAIWVQPLAAAAFALGRVFESGADDVHAGEVETSLVMALAPAAVGDGATDHVPAAGRDLIDMVPFATLAPGGVWGRPSLASKDKGEAALAAASDAVATYIRENLETLAGMKKGRRGLDR
jgi:creatinine amidohydrolase